MKTPIIILLVVLSLPSCASAGELTPLFLVRATYRGGMGESFENDNQRIPGVEIFRGTKTEYGIGMDCPAPQVISDRNIIYLSVRRFRSKPTDNKITPLMSARIGTLRDIDRALYYGIGTGVVMGTKFQIDISLLGSHNFSTASEHKLFGTWSASLGLRLP